MKERKTEEPSSTHGEGEGGVTSPLMTSTSKVRNERYILTTTIPHFDTHHSSMVTPSSF